MFVLLRWGGGEEGILLGDGKKGLIKLLYARVFTLTSNFGEGAATTSIQVDLLLLFQRYGAAAQTRTHLHTRAKL